MRSLVLVPGDDEVYVSVGEVVAGKYLVERVLGIGGMAFVVAARHLELDEPFALKFLARALVAQPAIVERFTREAKAACRIKNEHVARVYDVGTHEGAPFIVMEHLAGSDLATVLATGGALAVEDAADYAIQACEALAAAHAHGIVHRDIKPENLFLVEHEGVSSIKLLDFGISKMALTGGDPATRLTGELSMGTPSYMAPEQIRATASADERSDLWSLGVVLYELLAGVEAFQGTTVTELCAAVLEEEPRPLRELRPDVPPALAEIVARCMQKDPDRRFSDAAELAAALVPFAPMRAVASAERSSSIVRCAQRASGREPISSRAPAAPSLPPARARSASAGSSAPRRPDRRPVALVAGVVVLVGVVAGAAVAAKRERASIRPTLATPSAPADVEPVAVPAVSIDAGKRADPALGVLASVPKHVASPSVLRPRRAAPHAAAPTTTTTPAAVERPAQAVATTQPSAPQVELGY